jgi:hypothetical protein
VDRHERVQARARAAPDEQLLVVKRVGVRLYRDQFEPLLPLPEEVDPVLESVPVEPVTGGLPAEPPAEAVVALGSEVTLAGGTEVVPGWPLAVPVEPSVGSVPVVVPSVLGVVSEPVVGAPASVGIELPPSAVPSVPSPRPPPPVGGTDSLTLEVSCFTRPTADFEVAGLVTEVLCECDLVTAVRAGLAAAVGSVLLELALWAAAVAAGSAVDVAAGAAAAACRAA